MCQSHAKFSSAMLLYKMSKKYLQKNCTHHVYDQSAVRSSPRPIHNFSTLSRKTAFLYRMFFFYQPKIYSSNNYTQTSQRIFISYLICHVTFLVWLKLLLFFLIKTRFNQVLIIKVVKHNLNLDTTENNLLWKIKLNHKKYSLSLKTCI